MQYMLFNEHKKMTGHQGCFQAIGHRVQDTKVKQLKMTPEHTIVNGIYRPIDVHTHNNYM